MPDASSRRPAEISALSRTCSATSLAFSGADPWSSESLFTTAWRGLISRFTRRGGWVPSLLIAFMSLRMWGDVNLSAFRAKAGESTSRSLARTSATRSPRQSLSQATRAFVSASPRAPSALGWSESYTSAWSAAMIFFPSNSRMALITYSSTVS